MCPQVPSLLAAVLSAALAFFGGQAQESAATVQPATGPAITIHENVEYGSVSGTDLHLDIYEPAAHAAEPRPAVVLIHGGGWISFDKSTMRSMGNLLARHGFVAFAVDYRLFHDSQNRWPAQLDDVQRAVRWLRANAAAYGVNPARIGAFGHSAGAQLAALLGMEDTRDNSDPALSKYSSKVQAVVDVDGPTDFTTERDPDDLAFLAGFFGATYAKDPQIWRDASPAYHAAKDDVPFLIVHGTRDESVPISQAQELYEKLQAAGVPVSFIKVNDVHTFQTPEARRELALDSLGFFTHNLVTPQ